MWAKEGKILNYLQSFVCPSHLYDGNIVYVNAFSMCLHALNLVHNGVLRPITELESPLFAFCDRLSGSKFIKGFLDRFHLMFFHYPRGLRKLCPSFPWLVPTCCSRGVHRICNKGTLGNPCWSSRVSILRFWLISLLVVVICGIFECLCWPGLNLWFYWKLFLCDSVWQPWGVQEGHQAFRWTLSTPCSP